MRSKKGFTLIELLLVIAILGILIALILPRFEDIRTNANLKVCIGNLRGLANAMAIYETAKNTDVDWDTPAKYAETLVQWKYLAAEPYCPYAPAVPGAADRYTLIDDTGTAPDKATCPYVASPAPDGNTYTEHHWP